MTRWIPNRFRRQRLLKSIDRIPFRRYIKVEYISGVELTPFSGSFAGRPGQPPIGDGRSTGEGRNMSHAHRKWVFIFYLAAGMYLSSSATAAAAPIFLDTEVG